MEAIRIGRAVKELYLDTAAPVSPAVNRHASPKDNCSDDPAEVREGARCLCASACFFIWGPASTELATSYFCTALLSTQTLRLIRTSV
jgi:hypothetical protein